MGEVLSDEKGIVALFGENIVFEFWLDLLIFGRSKGYLQ